MKLMEASGFFLLGTSCVNLSSAFSSSPLSEVSMLCRRLAGCSRLGPLQIPTVFASPARLVVDPHRLMPGQEGLMPRSQGSSGSDPCHLQVVSSHHDDDPSTNKETSLMGDQTALRSARGTTFHQCRSHQMPSSLSQHAGIAKIGIIMRKLRLRARSKRHGSGCSE